MRSALVLTYNTVKHRLLQNVRVIRAVSFIGWLPLPVARFLFVITCTKSWSDEVRKVLLTNRYDMF